MRTWEHVWQKVPVVQPLNCSTLSWSGPLLGDCHDSVLREKQCCIFIHLIYHQFHSPSAVKTRLTFNTQRRSSTVVQSSSSSSNFWSFKDLLAIMLSITSQYFNTAFSMSYVELHWVLTSWGMRHAWREQATQALCQAGRAMVVEWTMTIETCRPVQID